MKLKVIVALVAFAATVTLAQRRPQRQPSGPLPPNAVKIEIEGDVRTIRSNGIPDHKPGDFPRRGNPNAISAQEYVFKMTTKPKPAAEFRDSRGAFFGVALNGVPFEAGTAEFWNGRHEWNYEALTGKLDLGMDENNAHVQPTGAYHYHGLPLGFMKMQAGAAPEIRLVGYAADGFPIYAQWGRSDAKDPASKLKKMKPGWRLKRGTRPSQPDGPGGNFDGTFTADFEFDAASGDLDEANGRFGVTPEYPEGIYQYYITEDFPYLPRVWRGVPDGSFFKAGPGPGRGGPPRGPEGPRSNRPFPPPGGPPPPPR